MYNLVMKDLKLGINSWFFVLPLITGALMLVPGWVYFLVPLYFCFISVPNILNGFKSQNDLMFSMMMPVSKKDIVKARIMVLVMLELIHLLVGMIFSIITLRLYPNINYLFFEPNLGFWGLCFMMMAIFNVVLIPLYYKTAYKHGFATTASIIAAIIFASGAQWLGWKSPWVNQVFYGSGTDNTTIQLFILIIGILIFIAFNFFAYNIALKRFLKVEIL